MKLNSVLLLLTFSTCLVNADYLQWDGRDWRYRRGCNYRDSWTLIGSQPGSLGPCVSKGMNFQRVDPSYTGGNLTVDAWTGGYERSVVTKSTYRVDRFDPCSGAFLGSYTTTTTTSEVADFPIDNPNLAPNVTESFVANAPMTDAEAQGAMKAASNRCLRNKKFN